MLRIFLRNREYWLTTNFYNFYRWEFLEEGRRSNIFLCQVVLLSTGGRIDLVGSNGHTNLLSVINKFDMEIEVFFLQHLYD